MANPSRDSNGADIFSPGPLADPSQTQGKLRTLGMIKETIDNCQFLNYPWSVIQNFRHKGLRRLFEDGDRRGIRADQVEKVENILAVLNRARVPADMDLPGFRLHRLKGDRKGFWSVTVRANWRMTFRFDKGHACDVDLEDYH